MREAACPPTCGRHVSLCRKVRLPVSPRPFAFLALALLLAAAGPLPAPAAGPVGKAPPPPSAAPSTQPSTPGADAADLRRVEDYLNGVRTLQSRFIQVAPDGRQATGTFYLSRPGKMRLEYDPPIRDFVVADGLFLFFWDGEMAQQSSAPIGSTLADFILRKDFTLSGDVTVRGVTRSPGVLEITLSETKDPGKGTITLVFEDQPLKLRKWRVVDAQGLTTEVGLLDPRVGVPLDRNLFYFREPEREDRWGRN